tara:strand:- start:73 stop:276 length:204 start_codon:yes stop_codon:yes gene_type:complete
MAKKGMSGWEWLAYVLVVVGAISWGLVGLVDWNLIDAIFGTVEWLIQLVYVLIGLSGLWILYKLFNM